LAKRRHCLALQPGGVRELQHLANASSRSRWHSDDNLVDPELRFAFQNSLRRSDHRNPLQARVTSAIIVKKNHRLKPERRLIHHMPDQLCPSPPGSDNPPPARLVTRRFLRPGSERTRVSKAESDH